MKLATVRGGAILWLTMLLLACGGGGGNGGGNNPGPGPAPRLSVDRKSITLVVRPGDATPHEQVGVSVANPPTGDLYVGAAYTTNGIESLDFTGTSASAGTLEVYFMPTASVPDGVYEDQIELHVCTDAACNDDIAGSPVTITTSYTIDNDRVAFIDRTSLEFHTDTQNPDRSLEVVQLTIPDQPFGGAWVEAEENGQGIDGIQIVDVTSNSKNINITLQAGSNLRPGIYDDTATISVYYDSSRSRHLTGSPFTVTSHVVVDAGAEPGLDPLQVQGRTVLSHDIVDAEYSKPLDAVVMVGTWPVNALYVFDINSGVERAQPLAAAPTAVSVAPDGLSAAVGHDGHISIVDLALAGLPGSSTPAFLGVAVNVVDLVLDGRGKVHALERFESTTYIHTVDIATGVEQLATGKQLYGGSLGRLHPSGDFIYSADRGVSSDQLNKWDLTVAPVTWVASSAFSSVHVVCGELWFREDGKAIYTACGNVFRSNVDPDLDMDFRAKLDLSGDKDFDFIIRSLSESDATNTVALVEGKTYDCEQVPPEAARCFTHLAYFDARTSDRRAIFAITPFVVGDLAYAQRGLFVFFDAAGNRKVLLSKLDGVPDPNAEYYLSIVQ